MTNALNGTPLPESITPLLEQHCFDCHAQGAAEGGIELDAALAKVARATPNTPSNPQLWLRVLKQVRAGLMPPEGERLESEEQQQLESWIKASPLAFDPADPDPGQVTLRRLNRVEYRNTIRDLMGVDYESQDIFPPDDTGHGFDNLGSVLTISPLLMEKYLDAAIAIVAQAVPTQRPSAKQLNPEKKEHAKYLRFFPRSVPDDSVAQRVTAAEILQDFARRAFRRPADTETLDRLVGLAETTWRSPGNSFEQGIAKAMVAVLASPRFLFREESAEPAVTGRHPWIDQYALASRLSYFFWSTMPDEELFQAAATGKLRENLPAQVARMLADRRSEQFTRNFVGQWLQVRDIETVLINSFTIAARDDPKSAEIEDQLPELIGLARRDQNTLSPAERDRLQELRAARHALREKHQRYELTGEVRYAMQRETELHFDYVVRENRPLTELISCNYGFLNERLAKFYQLEGIPGLDWNEPRRVELPTGSHRGGILTHGAILAVTSNPDRTSPVKRGLFVLENILGTPPAAPPPNVPPLEDFPEDKSGRPLSVRESMVAHRSDPLCHSCHARMDPLGLALENFSALGIWRDAERGLPLDASGELATGETFNGVDELIRVIVEQHPREFITCLTEKMLIYALGRGLDYHDVGLVDDIVDRVVHNGYRPQTLIAGIVESPAFTRTRNKK